MKTTWYKLNNNRITDISIIDMVVLMYTDVFKLTFEDKKYFIMLVNCDIPDSISGRFKLIDTPTHRMYVDVDDLRKALG